MAQVRAFLAAADRAEREQLGAQFGLLVTALRGDAGQIKALLRTLQV